MSRGYAAVGLFSPKTDANVGGVLRASMCFGASMVAIQGARYRKQSTDTTCAYRHIPLLHGDLRDLVPFDCVPVAVDLIEGATPIEQYKHPERAFYIFGPEDGTLGKAITGWCRDTIVIPSLYCLNLAAAVNVVLYDRAAKQLV